jgi:hypothetical protein
MNGSESVPPFSMHQQLFRTICNNRSHSNWTGQGSRGLRSGRTVYRAWAYLEIDKALLSAEVTITSEKDGSILAYLYQKVPRDVFVKYGPS